MLDYIYAIIRENETSKLKIITESTEIKRPISDYELCQFHDYAINLYDAYSSCLPYIDLQNYDEIPRSDLREKAVLFEDAIERLQEKYKDKLIAHSHRYGGWNTFEWQFNDDIKFVINTNFGYGSNSYFEQSIFYKDLKLAPYSKLVKYRYANFTEITSHTYSYNFFYSEWKKLMTDSLEFYNAIVEHKDNYIFSWLTRQLDKMVNELQSYISSSYCYFDNIVNCYNSYKTKRERVDGIEFWIAKSNKISEALLFIENIKELPVQVNPVKYVERIQHINNTFLPLLEIKIKSLKNEAIHLQEKIDEIANQMPLVLYNKLYDKYYYKKDWNLSKNKKSMIRFLMTILRRKSNIPNSEIRKQLYILEKQKKTLSELKSKFDHKNSIIDDLSNDRDKIIAFFSSKNTSDD